MKNIIPSTEPKSFVIGEQVTWRKYTGSYQTSDFELLYSFRKDNNMFDAKGINEPDHFLITLPTTKTILIEPGNYYWQAMLVSKSNEAIQIIAEGQTIVKANLALLEKYDGRSHVKQVLDALENMILGKASRDQSSYSIAGRSLSRLSPSELLKWRDLYKAEYAREQKGDRLRQGLASGNIIKVRF